MGVTAGSITGKFSGAGGWFSAYNITCLQSTHEDDSLAPSPRIPNTLYYSSCQLALPIKYSQGVPFSNHCPVSSVRLRRQFREERGSGKG